MANELQHLVTNYITYPNPERQEAVVKAALPLIRSIVGRMNIPDHLLATRQDMENVGVLGLLQALGGYNPDRGTPFVSYAYGRVRGALVDYLRAIDELPRERRRQLAAAQRTADVLAQQMGAEPMDEQIAEALEMSVDEYHTLQRDAQCRFAISLHASYGSDSEQMIVDTLPHQDTEETFAEIDRNSQHDYVVTLVKNLPEREQNILALYYYEDLTLREIAQLMSLTEARISQILSKVLKTLRGHVSKVQAIAA